MTISMLPTRTRSSKARPIRIDGDTAYVPLTRGYEAIIDAADAHLVADWSWNAKVKKNVVYARCGIRIDGVKKHFYMHQVILPPIDKTLPDHENGNGLDNRRGNLRYVTKRMNGRNIKGRPADHRTGVRFNRGKFEAWVYVGKFATKDEAHMAVVRSEKLLGLL